MDIETLSKLGPLATALAAVIALGVGIFTIIQRTKADRRSAWWSQTSFALDLVVRGERLGLELLTYLAESPLARKEELGLLAHVWETGLATAEAQRNEEYVIDLTERGNEDGLES